MAKHIISVIGPESTGKSDLASALAAHYKCSWLPEYARQYLDENGTAYDYTDLQQITAGQIRAMETATAETDQQLLIFDTDLLVLRVWSEFVFNKCDNRLLTKIAKLNVSLYLLCDTDLPWTADGMREYPDLMQRRVLFHHYKEMLTEQDRPWAIVSGEGEKRTANAIAAVENYLTTAG